VTVSVPTGPFVAWQLPEPPINVALQSWVELIEKLTVPVGTPRGTLARLATVAEYVTDCPAATTVGLTEAVVTDDAGSGLVPARIMPSVAVLEPSPSHMAVEAHETALRLPVAAGTL
jgi:hypothetical protein